MRASGARGGFTLVELLIASVMMAVLFVGLGAHLQGGIAVWRRATEAGETLQRRRMAFDRLARDLAGSLLYDDRDTAYGETLGLLPMPEFTSRTLVWFTASPMTRRTAPVVRLVTYFCGVVEETPGLWRISQSLGEARARMPVEPQRLLPDCAELSVRYASVSPESLEPVTWTDRWAAPLTSLPALVEVTVELESEATLTRLFEIPASLGSPPEAS